MSAKILDFNKIKKAIKSTDSLVDLDNKKADELAMDLVKHLACTTTSEDISIERVTFILDEIVHQINTKYI